MLSLINSSDFRWTERLLIRVCAPLQTAHTHTRLAVSMRHVRARLFLLFICLSGNCRLAHAFLGSPVIGIDFGDSCARVAVSRGVAPLDPQSTNKPLSCHDRRIIDVLPAGEACLPCFVAFTDSLPDSSAILVGAAAQARLVTDPHNVISDFRELLGRRFEDPVVQLLRSTARYKLLNQSTSVAIEVRQGAATRIYNPTEIASMVLGELKSIAEQHLGERVSNAILAVPFAWTAAQRQALKDAGTIAGLNVLRIMNEPTAAAAAYGLDVLENRVDDRPQTILLLSIGGSHTDLSVMSMDEGVFEVLATAVDPFGGRALDSLLLEHSEQLSRSEHGGKISDSLAHSLSALLVRVDAFLSSLNLTAASVDRLAIVGGMARLETVRRTIEKHVVSEIEGAWLVREESFVSCIV